MRERLEKRREEHYKEIVCVSGSCVLKCGFVAPASGGTSASAPTLAAIYTHVNDALISEGLPPIGFPNPLLYTLEKRMICFCFSFLQALEHSPSTLFDTSTFVLSSLLYLALCSLFVLSLLYLSLCSLSLLSLCSLLLSNTLLQSGCFHDIVVGSNACGQFANGQRMCCEYGYDAVPGYHPVV